MRQTSRQATHSKRSAVFPVLAIVCYLFTAAIVPAGHMAAPLGSGTAFHLCPGDARSSLIIDALAGIASNNDHHQHSHQHQKQNQEQHHDQHASGHTPTDPAAGHGGSGGHGSDSSETSAEAGCIFAGASVAFAADSSNDSDTLAQSGRVFRAAPRSSHERTTWLRPPVRSPPV